MAPTITPRLVTAWAATVPVACAAAAALVLGLNPPDEFPNYAEFAIVGDDYVVISDVFWEGHRTSGVWSSPFVASPDRVMLIDGSQAKVMLAGGDPIIRDSFPPWGVGNVDFQVPRFRCSGPTGGCMRGDLPTLVAVKGDAWHGIRRDHLQRAGDEMAPVGFQLSQGPQSIVNWFFRFATVATIGAATTMGAGFMWWRQRGERAHHSPVTGTEDLLQMTRLGELYSATISRYFMVTAALGIVGGRIVQFALIPRLVNDGARIGCSGGLNQSSFGPSW